MPTWTIKGGGAAAGCDLSWQTPVTANAEMVVNPDLTAAEAAVSWTYGSASTGTAVMPAGHTIQTNDKVDVYWAAGIAHGATATVSGTSVALAGATGDDLPASATAVVLCVQVAVSVAFVGNDVAALLGQATTRSLLCLVEGGGTAHPFELLPTAGLSWCEDDATANPLAGVTIASGTMSTTETTSSTKPITFGVLYDATPSYPG
jgi:hypothetical protein